MSISSILGGAGLGAVQHHHRWQKVSDTSGQTSDTSQTSQTASGGSQATAASGQAQTTLAVLLGSIETGGLRKPVRGRLKARRASWDRLPRHLLDRGIARATPSEATWQACCNR